jgi:hypothetical protein
VGGGFTTIAGQGKSDGTFSIPNVPAGTYYLQYGYPNFLYNYLITSAHMLDFGSDSIGRPDVRYSSAATTFSPTLSGLSPWGAKDHVEMLSANAGAYAYNVKDPANPPKAGDTSLMASKLAYQQYFYPGQLIDSTKSDQAYAYQLSTQMSASLGQYTALTNSVLLPSFSVVNAKDNPIAGTLAAAPPSTFSTHFAVSQFEKLATTGTPGAQVEGSSFFVESLPGGLMYGPLQPSADLIEFNGMPGGADADTGTLTYGNPFPASWGTYIDVVSGFAVSYPLPGLATPLTVQGTIRFTADVAALDASGLTPPIGPVLNMKVNGKPATGTLTGITTTPTISFDPPALGTASSYSITLAGVTVSSTNMPGTQPVAFFRTHGTRITVPAGALQSGAAYVAVVSANYAPNDSDTAPNHERFPQGSAMSISGLLEP